MEVERKQRGIKLNQVKSNQRREPPQRHQKTKLNETKLNQTKSPLWLLLLLPLESPEVQVQGEKTNRFARMISIRFGLLFLPFIHRSSCFPLKLNLNASKQANEEKRVDKRVAGGQTHAHQSNWCDLGAQITSVPHSQLRFGAEIDTPSLSVK